RADIQRLPYLFGPVSGCPVETIDTDDERDSPSLEEVHSGETGVEAARISQHDRPQRTVRQLVPHEPEAILPRSAEQIQDQLRLDRDPTEVQRDSRRRLLFHTTEIVDPRRRLGDLL